MASETDEKEVIIPVDKDVTPAESTQLELVSDLSQVNPEDTPKPSIPSDVSEDAKVSEGGLPPELVFNFDDVEEPADDTTPQTPAVNGILVELRESVPYFSEILSLTELLLARSGVDGKRFLEIGCGDAILSELLLRIFPNSTGVLLDIDEASLNSAWQRLGDKSGRMAFVAQDIADSEWAEAVKNVAPFDIILTSFVIDRQIDEHKVNIYSDIFEMLSPGGLFFNIDLVSISAPFARKVFDTLYVESLSRLRASKTGNGDRETAERDYAERPDKELILPAQTDLQCDWLRDLGFVGVDCFFRSLGIAFFGGAKPRKVSNSRNE